MAAHARSFQDAQDHQMVLQGYAATLGTLEQGLATMLESLQVCHRSIFYGASTAQRACLNSAEASCKLRNHNDDDGMDHNEHDIYTYACM